MRPMPRDVSETVSKADLLSDFFVLTKARLTALVLATTGVGFCLASREGVPWLVLLHTLFGTALVAGAASIINQIFERDADQLMERTRERPLAQGRMEAPAAWILALVLGLAGIVYLIAFVNLPAAVLSALTLAVYVGLYTPCKRISSMSTLLGAVSGAIPPVIGWVAAGGRFDAGAMFLFGLLFFWQLPHFVAINWLCRAEYERAGFVMWSNGDVSGRRSAWLTVLFSVVLLAWTLVPGAHHAFQSGSLYYAGAAFTGIAMLALSGGFLREGSEQSARRLFFYTLIYLPIMLALLLLTWR